MLLSDAPSALFKGYALVNEASLPGEDLNLAIVVTKRKQVILDGDTFEIDIPVCLASPFYKRRNGLLLQRGWRVRAYMPLAQAIEWRGKVAGLQPWIRKTFEEAA